MGGGSRTAPTFVGGRSGNSPVLLAAVLQYRNSMLDVRCSVFIFELNAHARGEHPRIMDILNLAPSPNAEHPTPNGIPLAPRTLALGDQLHADGRQLAEVLEALEFFFV